MKLNDSIIIYSNYEEDLIPIYLVKVISAKKNKLPFILTDDLVNQQVTYDTYNIKGEVIQIFTSNNRLKIGQIGNFKKRYIYSVGLVNTTMLNNTSEDFNYQIIKDKFISVENEEIY